MRLAFKDWIKREYLGIYQVHPWKQLAMDIHTKWQDFPVNSSTTEDDYLELAKWLYYHGACSACQSNFKAAWMNYINDN